MRIVIIADVYPPLRSSGAVQLRDLSLQFARQGYQITMIVASPELKEPWQAEMWEGVEILRLKTPQTKDVGYARRTLGELLMPFAMLRNLRKSPLAKRCWDGVVWYSPTIFLGPIVNAIKKSSGCRSYLIIRDIFPEWALDMGLISKGLPYRFFKVIANYQYSIADVIGIQTSGNQSYFTKWLNRSSGRLEVLHNWLADNPVKECSIVISKTQLAGRKIFVYAGNMGIAQGVDVLIDLAARLKDRNDIGFLFVGRGRDASQLKDKAIELQLNNVAFFDEIDPDEVPGLYAQCHAGMVALDPRHKTHNIPGKFLSYMRSGLPVLASINPGNDLVELIRTERVGEVVTDASVEALARLGEKLVAEIEMDIYIKDRCKALADRLFLPDIAVNQIVRAIKA